LSVRQTPVREYLRRAVEAVEMGDDCTDPAIREACFALAETWLVEADAALAGEDGAPLVPPRAWE
jgi:hypothetical protein